MMANYEKVFGYTSDAVVFTLEGNSLHVLLVKRSDEPFKGEWALPGGFINKGETSKEVVLRKLEEETGLSGIFVSELGMYDKFGRDSRGWIISNAYYSILNRYRLEGLYAGERTVDVKLIKVSELDNYDIAFDHKEIIQDGYNALERDMRETLVAKEFLDEEFVLSDLYNILYMFNAIKMEKSNFFNKVKKLGFLEHAVDNNGKVKTLKLDDGVTKRPVTLYKFNNVDVKASIY